MERPYGLDDWGEFRSMAASFATCRLKPANLAQTKIALVDRGSVIVDVINCSNVSF